MVGNRRPGVLEKVEVGSDLTLTKPQNIIYAYGIETDGANNARIRIYKTSKIAANQLWTDVCIGGDNVKTFGFPHEAAVTGILIIEITGTGATGYVERD